MWQDTKESLPAYYKHVVAVLVTGEEIRDACYRPYHWSAPDGRKFQRVDVEKWRLYTKEERQAIVWGDVISQNKAEDEELNAHLSFCQKTLERMK